CTEITRWVPSVRKDTRSLTQTVPLGDGGHDRSSFCCGSTAGYHARTGSRQKADRFWSAPSARAATGMFNSLAEGVRASANKGSDRSQQPCCPKKRTGLGPHSLPELQPECSALDSLG